MSRITQHPTALPPGELAAVPDHLSFSQMTKLSSRYVRSCPRAWAYNRLMGLQWPSGVPMILGSALDDAVADFLRRRMMGDSANKALNDSIGKIDERIALSEDWPGDKGRVEYVAMMHQAFELFVETYPDLVPASIQRDHVYMVRTLAGGQRKMIGYSDWIEPDGTIVDLKFTGSARWNAAGVWAEDWLTEKRDQVCTYYMGRLYAERVGTPDPTSPVIPRGKIVVVCASMYRKNPVVKEHTFTFDDELVAELADAVRDADNVAVSEYHEPRPGEACRWCSYTDRCKNDSRRFAPLTRELAMVPN